MKRYVVHAFENCYGALHGMEEWFWMDAADQCEVEREAVEASYDVMNSYKNICDMLEDELEEERSEYVYNNDTTEGFDEDSVMEELRAENVAYIAYELNDDALKLTAEEMESFFQDGNYNDLLDLYAEKEF